MVDPRIDKAIRTILDQWDEWEGEAGQAAQIDQDSDSWDHVMSEYLRGVLSEIVLKDAGTIGFLTGCLIGLRQSVPADIRVKIDDAIRKVKTGKK